MGGGQGVGAIILSNAVGEAWVKLTKHRVTRLKIQGRAVQRGLAPAAPRPAL